MEKMWICLILIIDAHFCAAHFKPISNMFPLLIPYRFMTLRHYDMFVMFVSFLYFMDVFQS